MASGLNPVQCEFESHRAYKAMKTIEDIVYTVSKNNIKVVDSWDVSKETFDPFLKKLREENPENAVLVNRSNKSLRREWALHNFLYDLGLWKSHTKDVDLNYPLKWYVSAIYWVFGAAAMIFIS